MIFRLSTLAPAVGPRQRWLAAMVVAALLLGAAATTPFCDVPMTPVPGLLVMFSTAMLVCNLLLSALLFIKGQVEAREDSIRLAAAYLYASLIIIPQTASFPGALMAAPLIGTPETSLWFWIFWHVGFGLAVIRYAWSGGRPSVRSPTVLKPIATVLAVTVVVSTIATAWAHRLPPLVLAGHFAFSGAGLVAHAAVSLVMLAALVSVLRVRCMTPEHLWLVVGLVASCVEVWLTLNSTARYALGWYLAKAGSLLTSVVVLISLMHEITRLYSEAALANARLSTLARRDALTGLSNRRHFDEMIVQEFRRARRHERPVTVIMIDVDCFKAFNDLYGHPAGDDCLRRVAAAIRNSLRRPADHAARYGGEEIVVLLPETDPHGACIIAERIREAVVMERIAHAASPHGVVTISAGVATRLPLDDFDTAALLEAADRALYRAKRSGRNRVAAAAHDDAPVEVSPMELKPVEVTPEPGVVARMEEVLLVGATRTGRAPG
jgi:diguanylate cyclase (GGDEF)-like protein